MLKKQETTFTPFSKPGIEKCMSKEVDQEALHLYKIAWPKLFIMVGSEPLNYM